MASENIKNAILRAKIEGIIYDIMVKTNAANVVVDDAGTTLSAKLAEILTAIAGKAEAAHSHEQSEVTGLADALSARPTTEVVNAAIDALRQELLGDTPVDAYNTFTELAAYIEEHQDAADALVAAVGNKADKATTLAGYGITDAYTSAETDQKIADAVKTATGGESAATVKTELDAYKTSNDAAVAALEAKAHEHSNKAVLDGISADNVAAWNGKSKVHYSATEPSDLAEGDLWVQLID